MPHPVFPLRPRRAGALLLLAALLAACARPAPDAPPPAPRVTVSTIRPAPLALYDDLPGRVVPVRVAEIRPQVSGIIQRRLFEQGAQVRAGQPLFQLLAAPFKAEADIAAAALQRAEATLARAREACARLAPLVDADAISRQAYDDALAERDQAAADVAQARAALARRQLDLRFATVEAPIAGRIEQALVSEGALVAPGDSAPLARVVQLDKVYVDVRRPAAAYEALRASVAAGAEADTGGAAPVPILRSDRSAYHASGKLLFSGMTVDSATGDVLLRILVENPRGELLPGMFVHARVPGVRMADALTLPQQAVVRLAGRAHVWVIDSKGVARLVAVELGALHEHRYHIRAGLQSGQRVVVEGMERLSEGMATNAHEWQPAAAATH